ncbi:hypothetical protein NQ318_003377 [Aromia moschata]|uniref:Protein wntless n=1 Tax=Aromia moschata TaxID=1265417 RepID=A0AAV8Y8Z6_9CUCU|nr:hypothetical protein NQ318_003377 [Aromia moschata]
MPGTILENLSGKKLSVLVTILLASQLACFLVGLIAPSPAKSQPILTTVCIDENPAADNINRWFTRKCPKSIELSHEKVALGLDAKNLVFVAEMPLYDQNLVGVLQLDVLYQEGHKVDKTSELTLDARLAYSDKSSNNGRTPWQYLTHAEEKRYMDCVFEDENITEKDGYPYSCTMVHLFELGSIYHDYYLLNLRLPYNDTIKKNVGLGKLGDIYLHMIHMNGGYMKVWVSLKTFFFPIIIGIMVWFWRRVHMLNRMPALLEYMLMSLGGTLAFLNLPVEYLTLIFDMPYMLLVSDIRQGIFYAMLLSFWLVFAGEHMLIQDNGEKNSLKMYWKHLSTIVIGCVCLLIFDLCERGVQLVNPFYSIWVTPIGTNLALSFIILAGMSASMYFIFLCYMIWQVFKNISIKKAILPSMSQARRLHYEGIIYLAEGQNKWDEDMDLELSSVLHTGVYGMWNVYICAMLMLYAPSHKQWPSDTICGDGEEVEFSRLPTEAIPSQISSLTSFATKASIE